MKLVRVSHVPVAAAVAGTEVRAVVAMVHGMAAAAHVMLAAAVGVADMIAATDTDASGPTGFDQTVFES